MEHVVRQKPRSNWIIDIAHTERMIAIEVNGASHNSAAVKARDRRRREFLESQGWTVIAIPNREILENLAHALLLCTT